jgi:hypothetical protein
MDWQEFSGVLTHRLLGLCAVCATITMACQLGPARHKSDAPHGSEDAMFRDFAIVEHMHGEEI